MEFDASASDCRYLTAWLEHFAGGKERAGILLAFLGCCLYGIGADKHQKILNLYGAPGAGKSDFIKLAECLSTSAIYRSLSDIEGDKYGLDGLDDCDLLAMSDESGFPVKLENTKKLFGADKTTANGKYRDSTQILFTGNGILSVNDANYLGRVSQRDREAFKRHQIAIKVSPRAVIKGFPVQSETSHGDRLRSELPCSSELHLSELLSLNFVWM